MSAADDDRRAEKFVDVRRSENRDGVVWRLTVWRLGGNIEGSAQPFKILNGYECSDAQVALVLELDYPEGFKYAPVPQMIAGRLFVYDLTFDDWDTEF